jgi:hypothetical protein
MPIKSRLPFAAALLTALVALAALLGAGSAGALPKKPLVIERKVAVSVSGTITYRWTYDNREKCVPGFSKTIEEELRFNFPTRKTKMTVAIGRLVMPPLLGGTSQLDVRLGGWQTTNYCSPHEKAKEPPEPVCKSGASPLAIGITSTVKDIPTEDEDELAPLSRETQVLIGRTKGLAQDPTCSDGRPKIPFEFEDDLGWFADPTKGATLGMHFPALNYGKLKKGKTLRRQIQISGGCGGASAHASAVSTVPPQITKCTLDGVVFVKVTGLG